MKPVSTGAKIAPELHSGAFPGALDAVPVAVDSWANRGLVLVAMAVFVVVLLLAPRAAFRWPRSRTWGHSVRVALVAGAAVGAILVMWLSHDVDVRSHLGAVVVISFVLGAGAVLFSSVVERFDRLVERRGPVGGSPLGLLARMLAICLVVAVPVSLELESWRPVAGVLFAGWVTFLAIQAGAFGGDD